MVIGKLPPGLQKVWSWLFAFLYLIGLPAGFARISHTGLPGYLFALFLLLFIGQGWSMYLAARSKFWPTTQGTVVSSRVARYLDSETAGKYWYGPKITYRYQVDGREYENNLLSFKEAPVHTPDRQYAKSIAAKYPRGSKVTVYYKPDSPSYAALEPGLGDAWPWLLLVLFFFAAAGFGGYIALGM